MDRFQNSRAYKIDKQVPGCLGRMVHNLFDVGAGVSAASRLLTDKPHRDARNRSEAAARKLNPPSRNKKGNNHKTAAPDLRNLYYIKSHPTSTKMLSSANEIVESKHGPQNVVARLMGLDALPQKQQGYHTIKRSQPKHTSSHSMVPGRHYWPQDQVFPPKRMRYRTYPHHQEHNNNDYKDVYEVQKEFEDAVEVLNSNKEFLLKVLKEPNALTSKPELVSTIVPQKTKRITVLRPSKMDRERFPDKNSPCVYPASASASASLSYDYGEEYDNSHPAQIVVLKPSGGKISLPTASPKTFDGDEVENGIGESRKMANEANYLRHRRSSSLSEGRHETSVSSDWYAPESFIDSEVPSPGSRHSWDYVNRLDSPFSLSYLSRASYSPETSVCREAKRRLSERMASDGTTYRDERHSLRSSYTLGEMLDRTGPKASEVHVAKDSSKKTEASSSLKLKVSSLLFSRNNKRSTEKKSQPVEESRPGLLPKSCPDSAMHRTLDTAPKQEMSIPKAVACRNTLENQDQPSPVSVLDLFYEEDTNQTPESSSGKQRLSNYSHLSSSIGKSPIIGSVSRTLTWGGSEYAADRLNAEDDEQEWLSFAREFLSTMKWHSPENPLDQSLRERDSNCGEEEGFVNEARKRRRRSNRKLAFDSVNSAVAEITGHYGFDSGGAHDDLSSSEDRVWHLVREWRAGERDNCSLVVERVARKEVVLGGFWNRQLRLEIHKLGEEIGRELLLKLVDQTVCDLLSTMSF